mgnify:CR=1 FL=1
MNKLITISSVLLTAAAVKAQTPNIVFILADDLGYGDISAFNPESKIHTPNIDKLAEHGIGFTDAHASSALSTPSRYSLLTGRYPWRTKLKRGGLDGDSPAMIDPERRTIAHIIGDKRYENEVKEMKRAMKQYVENGRSTPGEKVSNDTKNSWNQVKNFMQEE